MHGQQLLQEIEILPPELQKQVSDFVVFLRKQQQKQVIKKRTVGEYKNKIFIHDDFDEPLGDDFCLGEQQISNSREKPHANLFRITR